jgi:malate dehydrogenase (oxaloacetate-decarboxylating)
VRVLRVVDAMRKEMVNVDEDVSAAEASAMIREKGEGCAIVLSKGSPIGIMTERDIMYKIAAEGLDARKIKVGEIMSTPLVEIDPDADLVEAAKLMEKYKVRRLAVVKKGILYGVISAIDVARNLEGYVEDEVRKIVRHAFFMG